MTGEWYSISRIESLGGERLCNQYVREHPDDKYFVGFDWLPPDAARPKCECHNQPLPSWAEELEEYERTQCTHHGTPSF